MGSLVGQGGLIWVKSPLLVYVYDCVKRSLGDTNERTDDILHVFSNGKFIMTIH